MSLAFVSWRVTASTTHSCGACGQRLHDFERLPAPQYSYLLGVYLGDGTVSRFGRAFGLRVFMDSRYSSIIGEVAERKIELAPWQEAIVDRKPEQFVRGLIHSDGCRVMNRVVVDGKDYAYPGYFFTQVSKDIQALFCRSLDRLGVDYTFASRGRTVSVARAGSIARLDSFVGPKS